MKNLGLIFEGNKDTPSKPNDATRRIGLSLEGSYHSVHSFDARRLVGNKRLPVLNLYQRPSIRFGSACDLFPNVSICYRLHSCQAEDIGFNRTSCGLVSCPCQFLSHLQAWFSKQRISKLLRITAPKMLTGDFEGWYYFVGAFPRHHITVRPRSYGWMGA